MIPMPTRIEPLFVSHGSPETALRQTAAHHFLKSFGADAPRPRAILTVSAHFETDRPALVADPAPGMIYDFGGFDPRLRDIVYAAPGAPDVAMAAHELLADAGLEPQLVEQRGYDHGVWVPLVLIYSQADISVAQLSVQPGRDAAWHYKVGRALAPLADDGVLVLGSGSLTHNLHELFTSGRMASGDTTSVPWVEAFSRWIAERLGQGDTDALLDYRRQAPFAVENHPTDEHLMPLFVALGAAREAAAGTRIHESVEFGLLAMDAYRMEV
ncbi:MAG: dioxygenase [Hyphomicrobiales bacterium]|nr:dioxygenase [Hyphomicrobiales bacterium]